MKLSEELKRARRKAYNAAYHAAHLEARRAYHRAYKASHQEQTKAYRAAYRPQYEAANREKIKARKARYQAAHKEEIKAYRAAYYAAHKAKIRADQAAYRKAHCTAENRERSNARGRAYRKAHPGYDGRYKQRRRLVDPKFKLVANLRTRVFHALQKGSSRSAHTMELLGCTIPEWRAHLESRFRPGMTWENYGPVWHVDHIKPCAKFDLTDPVQQRACFHFSNTQPLFALDNLRKNAKQTPKSHEQLKPKPKTFSEIASIVGDSDDSFRGRAENY